MDTKRDIIIIGAGVVGCSIALALSRRGFRTINVDALPAAGYGSTSHSSAIIRPFYSHVTSAAVAHESRFHWLDWAGFLNQTDESGLARYRECGGLVLVREGDEADYRSNVEVLETVGVDYEWLTAADLERRIPGISLDAFGPPRPRDHPEFGQPVPGRISGAIHIPAAGYVSDPQLAARNLEAAARGHDAAFRFNAGIVEILTGPGGVEGVVIAGGERVEAGIVVNAAGPHSGVVNAMAGILDDLPITTRAHRHEVAYLPAPDGYVENGNGFLVDLDAGFYQRPDGGDLLIGTADPDCDPPDIVDPDDYDPSFTEQWTTQVHRAGQRFPTLGIENTARGTVGLYDVSDDWIPIYDCTDLPGFYLAIGTSGNQFKNAPLIGEILAEIIQQDQSGPDHDRTPATLALPHVGRAVSLDFYSRNRPIQQTRSVLA
jgi:sarcosine oxidase subunit beta